MESASGRKCTLHVACLYMDAQSNLIAGEHYPQTYQEFLEWFADEAACRQYVKRCRWPQGFECGHCGTKTEPWTTSRGYFHFRVCESEKKQIVVIAVEILSPKGLGRVRMRRIPDVSGESLVPFVCDVAEQGSEILTDGWRGYNRLSKRGYKHQRTVASDSGDPAHVNMPGVHRIASLVNRWLLSTHQGTVSQKHFEYYLDE